MFTRIMRLPRHDHVLVGRDLADMFLPNHVYSVQRFRGEFIIKDLGISSLPPDIYFPNQNSQIQEIMMDSMYLITLKERENDL